MSVDFLVILLRVLQCIKGYSVFSVSFVVLVDFIVLSWHFVNLYVLFCDFSVSALFLLSFCYFCSDFVCVVNCI